jgi:hydroxyacylglutathione hydrolase
MSLRFEQFLTEGIAQLSYLVGDDDNGAAAVIDPRADVDIYVKAARKYKLSITHVFETHIHADFVSGARELAARTGAGIYLSKEGGARYGFEHESIKDGDTFEFGSVRMTCRFTPGHTPEHMSYLLAEKDNPDKPWSVLSGDSLFVSSAGRPDLLGEDQSEKLANQLFDTLRDFYLRLADHVLLYPGHGHGSPCGADIGDRLVGSIGYERFTNKFLQIEDRKAFVEYALSTAPPTPRYYPRMKQVNAEGPKVLGTLPTVPGLPPDRFKKAHESGRNVLVDTRSMLAFGGGHIPGALNIGSRPELSIWAGWMLDPKQPILLVLDEDSELEDVVALFVRTGHIHFAGYLVGGMKAWDNAGLPLAKVPQMTVHELKDADGGQILDVRAPSEWQDGHVPGAEHHFLPELRQHARSLDRNKRTIVYCDSGYRASLGASVLQAEGFREVHNVPGSWQAWQSAGLPVAQESHDGNGHGGGR